MSRKADRHPHHAGHRHAGIAVGENAKRSGAAPGQTEFSADQERAMRQGAPGAADAQPAMPAAAPSMAPSSPTGGTPAPDNLDTDGGM